MRPFFHIYNENVLANIPIWVYSIYKINTHGGIDIN